jgi:hypothetical protein
MNKKKRVKIKINKINLFKKWKISTKSWNLDLILKNNHQVLPKNSNKIKNNNKTNNRNKLIK